jgi:ABC-type multidrug transport system fused ATPase/permease subunit
MFAKVQSKLDKLTRHTRDNLRGVRVIRAFNHQDEQVENFDSANTSHAKETIFAGRVSSLLNPLTYVIVNLAVIMIVKNGGLAVDSGRLTQGQIIALYNYMSQILVELVKLANLIVTLTKAGACAKRINAVLAMPIESDEEHEEVAIDLSAPAIEFRNASFRYRLSKEDSLSNISFTLGAGERLGVLGGTGSGKTTLVDLIPRFYDVTDGEVLVFGRNVKDYPVMDLRKLIAVVPQSSHLFAGTVAENMRWGNPNASDDDIRAALEAAGALDFVLAKEGGIEARVEARGANFSGGQRQRLAIARALIRKPKILILDDSFSALDFATDLLVRSNIAKLEDTPATVIISQRPSAVKDCDSIVVLDDGASAGIGRHDELLASCSVYRETYETQYGGEN